MGSAGVAYVLSINDGVYVALVSSSPTDDMNFLKLWCLGQEWRRWLEAAEKTVSRSFLCLGFVVVSQSCQSNCFVVSRGRVHCGENVWLFL